MMSQVTYLTNAEEPIVLGATIEPLELAEQDRHPWRVVPS